MLHYEPCNDISWINNLISAQLCYVLCNAIPFITGKCHVVILECQVVIGYDLYNITCTINEVPDSSFIMECQIVINYNLYNITPNVDGVPGSLCIVECHVVILEYQVVYL